jgi:hypothetical protein
MKQQSHGTYPVLKAPTHCGVWGRVFLGSLSLAFYYARRLIRTQKQHSHDLLKIIVLRYYIIIVCQLKRQLRKMLDTLN